MSRGRDHPRVCGEHARAYSIRAKKLGSSPRMRGTPIGALSACGSGGIIPAYAGNTRRQGSACRNNWDHPRVCGEHHHRINLCSFCLGSSPRMRGTHPAHRTKERRRGIIPAYAGNTAPLILRLPLIRDHPRVCGEHFSTPRLSFRREGSSPRMRGTH